MPGVGAKGIDAAASGSLTGLDRLLLVLTPIAAIAIILGFHRTLDVEGMGLNVIAVATAYLAVLALLGLGWTFRYMLRR